LSNRRCFPVTLVVHRNMQNPIFMKPPRDGLAGRPCGAI
jgi:hypothetical protein